MDEIYQKALRGIEDSKEKAKLYLGEMNLKELPQEIGQLSALQALYLQYNQLDGLPREIGQLSSLRKLYLENNQLTCLPCEISQLVSLQALHLDGNQLTCLPCEISNLTNLTRNEAEDPEEWGLRLYNNNFDDIPEEIFYWQDPQEIIKYILDHQKAKKITQTPSPPPPSAPPM